MQTIFEICPVAIIVLCGLESKDRDSCCVAIVKASKVLPFQARLKQFCLVIRDQGWLLEYLS